MPGGRLTLAERQQIAARLTDGLGYAEIARMLARPTSTVSREVGRNGGPRDYRVDQAHRATQGRARRTNPAPPTVAPPTTNVHGRDPEAVRDLEKRLTAMVVQTGLPRTAARVLTCLYTTDSGSLTAAELARHLRVSPATISTAISLLQAQGLVGRERDPSRRRDRYVVDDDVWYRAWLASARINAVLAGTAVEAAQIFGAMTPAGARLEEMGRFFAQVGDDMITAAERWRGRTPSR